MKKSNNQFLIVIETGSTDYGEYEIDIQVKKKHLLHKLLSGDAVIVYSSKEDTCVLLDRKIFSILANHAAKVR